MWNLMCVSWTTKKSVVIIKVSMFVFYGETAVLWHQEVWVFRDETCHLYANRFLKTESFSCIVAVHLHRNDWKCKLLQMNSRGENFKNPLLSYKWLKLWQIWPNMTQSCFLYALLWFLPFWGIQRANSPLWPTAKIHQTFRSWFLCFRDSLCVLI